MSWALWTMENPMAGIVEADDRDHERVLDVARPYLGELVGDWTPLVEERVDLVPLLWAAAPAIGRGTGSAAVALLVLHG
jgi:hypothetical protein